MPELPEVESVVRSLRPAVLGRTVHRVVAHRRDYFHPWGRHWLGLELTDLISVERRGKRILIENSAGDWFYAHLGMTGRLLACKPTEPRPPHTHCEIVLSDGVVLRSVDPRRFGNLTWLGKNPLDVGLGPEPFAVTPQQLAGLLRRTRRTVKAALLDQSLIAGLGNIYVDEALHAAAIAPSRLTCEIDLEEVRRLNRAIKSTLRRAIRLRGSSIRDYVDSAGQSGQAQKAHRVYGRAGKPCLNCRSPILRTELAGRGTHWCSICQPAR